MTTSALALAASLPKATISHLRNTAGSRLTARMRHVAGETGAETAEIQRRAVAPASAIALGGGAVFAIGLLAAMAPITTDTAPHYATAEAAAAFHVARAGNDLALRHAARDEAAMLPSGADLEGAAAIVTGAITAEAADTDTDIADEAAEPLLRGAVADPIGDVSKAYEAETAEVVGPPSPVRQTTAVEVKSGDTLSTILTRAGVTAADARAAIASLGKIFKPRDLRVGQTLEVEVETPPIEVAALDAEEIDAPDSTLLGFSLKADAERSVRVARTAEDGFEAQEIFRPLTENVVRAKGEIEDSLFVSTAELGVPAGVTVEFMKLYAYSVDFQREIRQGDSFEIYYSEKVDDDGNRVKSGDILYASLTTAGKPKKLWRFEVPGEGTIDYFDENGQSMRKFLMKTPIDGARISSTFGMRRHPVLGYSKLHSGVDFAAPTGTPIYAAGNGTITFAGWKGANGKLVYIRHANDYITAYAHMSRIARGITKGARVTQGQVIGYVGTTGRSTGPHLHYEVKVHGKPTNPMTLRVPTGRKLEGKELTAFKSTRDGISADMAAIAPLSNERQAASAAKPDAGTSIE